MDDNVEHVSSDIPPSWIVTIAQEEGPELTSGFRVVVIEGDGRPNVTDFPILEEALKYADDAASESDVPWPIAYVFARGPRYIRRGRHYAEKHLTNEE
jgi:hypothetical protein